MDLLSALPALAPLAEDQVRNLLIYRERLLPRGEKGRPIGGTPDRIAREEARQRQALRGLLADLGPARQRVFELLGPLVVAGQLSRRALLDILYPSPRTPYPERLGEWVREKYLWFDRQGNLASQPTSAILLQRQLDPRKRQLPPARTVPRSFFCWRQEAREQPPFPYELPLALVNEDRRHPVYEARPADPDKFPYILRTAWWGVGWDDKNWLAHDTGAIRWVGEPTEEELARWLSPQEMGTLAVTLAQEDRATLALRILARVVIKNGNSD